VIVLISETKSLLTSMLDGVGVRLGKADAVDVLTMVQVFQRFAAMPVDDAASPADDGDGILAQFLRAHRIVVLHGDEAWVAPLEEAHPRGRTSRSFDAVARLGPAWEPGTLVNIVIRLSGENGVARLVRVPDQRISRTS
jgi:hypothetical protein